jgi:pimeloyl-ACP methyl ester carboxylesterase
MQTIAATLDLGPYQNRPALIGRHPEGLAMKRHYSNPGLLLLCISCLWSHSAAAQGTLTPEQCSALQQTTITPAQIGEPVSAVHIDTAKWDESTAAVHCRIDGRLLPVDTAANARPINFGVALPAAWNGRAVQLGGGGMNGTVPALAGRGPDSQLAQGYATYGSDSGHAVSDDPSWLLNDEAIRNLGFQQMKKTHDAALLLIEAAYSAAPAYNYYVGGSQGGREGLTVAQRYPQDYAGVLSTVPIVGFSSLMLGPSLIRIQEIPQASWVPATMGSAILAEFMRQCDALDGSTDAVINNYVDCRARFNVNDDKADDDAWAALRCADGATGADCLSAAQIDTLGVIFSDHRPGVALPNGRSHFGMWAPTTAVANNFPAMGNMAPPGGLLMPRRYRGQEGAEADAPVFTTLGTEGVTGIMMQNPAGNPLDYSDAEHGARRAQVAAWLDSTQSDLGAFSSGGSKLIVIVGTDDTIAPSGEQLDYYQSLIDTMGRDALDAFARLYVLPQTGHGLSGRSAAIDGAGQTREPVEIPNQVDRFALLVDWVERGVAPAMSVEVSGSSGTRPMCSYPDYPHYQGGDVNQAQSYSCMSPVHAD